MAATSTQAAGSAAATASSQSFHAAPPRSATSAKVGIPIHATTRPSISGTPQVGRTLTVMAGWGLLRAVSLRLAFPEVARDMFIRHALVEGEWDGRHEFLATNRKLVRRLEALEERDAEVAALRARLDLPVLVANDANAAVLAEYTFGGAAAAEAALAGATSFAAWRIGRRRRTRAASAPSPTSISA